MSPRPQGSHDIPILLDQALPRTRALLEQGVRDRTFPGAVCAVYADAAVRAQIAVGRFRYEEDAPPVEPHTVYDLASLTKVVATTAMAMLLFDRGLLPLDAPVCALMPSFAASEAPSGIVDTRRALVTVRMLLDHSSGLPGYGRLFEHATGRDAMLCQCLLQPLTADPGTRAEYSDIGFMILGALLEQIAGETLDRFCAREFFTPLGMHSARFCPPSAARAAIPPTEIDHDVRRRVIQGEVHDENAWAMGGISGHAGLFSHAIDVLRYAACILRSGRTAAGESLARPETVALFAKRTGQPNDSSRALGWDTPSAPSSSGGRFSPRSIGHLGFTGTSLWIDLDAGIAVVLLTNRTWPDRSNQAIRTFRPRLHDTLREELGY